MPEDADVELTDLVGGVPPEDGGSSNGESSMDPDMMKLLLASAGRTLEMMNQGSSHYAEDSRRQWLQNSTQVTQQGAVAMRVLSGPHLSHGSPDNKA